MSTRCNELIKEGYPIVKRRTESGNHPSTEDVTHAQTFPEDYMYGREKAEYICGMSVPPIMIKRIMTRLIESGIFKE